MCGISGVIGKGWEESQIRAMYTAQHHRGPDDTGIYYSESKNAALAHNRLSIIDLSKAGHQPMSDISGRYKIIFNGEVYNYLEIRKILENEFTFRTQTDTEVVLYSYIKWGKSCLHKFIGMFAFGIWDETENTFWGVRDRLGIKPFNYAFDHNLNFVFASEIKSLHAYGIDKKINLTAWATYLERGLYDHDESTFWEGVKKLPAGHMITVSNNKTEITKWYDLHNIVGDDFDSRPLELVMEEYMSLLEDSIKLRFRADVPVGINISGGLDSSALLNLVNKVQGKDNQINAFTFYTGDENYDELPWVKAMIETTHNPLIPCLLTSEEIPSLAESIQFHQDEPYGGFPTMAYAKIFEKARSMGIIVLLDGQGMDEQWAGYDYYRKTDTTLSSPTIQGTLDSPVRPDCLSPEFRRESKPMIEESPFKDKLRNLQYRDTIQTKIPRALRFNDRVSMRSSTELREPFMDHRLFELAYKQPEERKINEGKGKWFMRKLLSEFLPGKVVEAPKRALQTPQREWLRNDLSEWANDSINNLLSSDKKDWFNTNLVKEQWESFQHGKSDNSFYVWQWINLSLLKDK